MISSIKSLHKAVNLILKSYINVSNFYYDSGSQGERAVAHHSNQISHILSTCSTNSETYIQLTLWRNFVTISYYYRIAIRGEEILNAHVCYRSSAGASRGLHRATMCIYSTEAQSRVFSDKPHRLQSCTWLSRISLFLILYTYM